MISFGLNWDFWAILFPKSIKARVSLHILFWVFFVAYHLIYFIPLSFEILVSRQTVLAYTLYYARYIPIFYACIRFNKILRKYFKGLALWLAILFSATIIMHFVTVLTFILADRLIGLENTATYFHILGQLYLSPFEKLQTKDLLLLIYDLEDMQLLILPVGILMIKFGILHERRNNQLKADQLKSQLQSLRSQLSPHFVFNIINATFSEILPISKKAATYLAQVSEILRFTLYETSQNAIPLKKEIRALKQLVQLQSIRVVNRTRVTYTQKGKVKPSHQIPTLLLVSLAENAFKHGVYASSLTSSVDIRIEVLDDILLFYISNSKPVAAKATDKKHSGIGLKNLTQSLELHFQNSYSCSISETDEDYTVTLQIPLIF